MTSPLISDTTLAHIRATAARLLTDTCDLHSDASGRPKVQSDVPCRVTAATGAGNPYFSGAGDRPEVEGVWIVRLPVGTDVSPGWQVRMTSDTRTEGLRGRIFTLTGDLAGSDEITRRVLATEGQ
jgi:hypothetical protein